MSYDWHLNAGDKICDSCDGTGKLPHIIENRQSNFTWNILPMFYEALGPYITFPNGKSFAETMGGRRAGELIEPFSRAVADMERYPTKYQVMNPPNGWGSYDTALDDLRRMRDACIEHPDTTYEVR